MEEATVVDIPRLKKKEQKLLHRELADAMQLVIKEETIVKELQEDLAELKDYLDSFKTIHQVKDITTKTELLQLLLVKKLKRKGKGILNKIKRGSHFERLLRRIFSKIEEQIKKEIKRGNNSTYFSNILTKMKIYERELLKALSKQGSIYKALSIFNEAQSKLRKRLNENLLTDFSGIEHKFSTLYNKDLSPLFVLLQGFDHDFKYLSVPKSPEKIKLEIVTHLDNIINSLTEELHTLSKAPSLNDHQHFFFHNQERIANDFLLLTKNNILELEKSLVQFMNTILNQTDSETEEWLINEVMGNVVRPTLFILKGCHSLKQIEMIKGSAPGLDETIKRLKRTLTYNRLIKTYWVEVIENIIQRDIIAAQKIRAVG